jgi:DNA modification methylase
MGVPTKVVQWVYNSNMGKQHRSIAFFNCKPDFSKVKQPYKNLKDKRIIKNILNGSEGSRLYDWWNINLVKGNVPEKEDYSNQIPEQVISNIIKIVAQENDVIFDPFMGSGTTPAVASKLGFKYAATDISEKAYNITNKRLSEIENNLFRSE